MKKKILSAALIVLTLFTFGCAGKISSDTYISETAFDGITSFKVKSNDVKNGVWEEKISNTSKGENKSPDLNWDAVDGALLYEVIMIDGTWLHMEVSTRDTSVDEGTVSGRKAGSRYVGPYPPVGSTHTYSVFVFALKNEPGKVPYYFDSGSNSINDIYNALNTDADGNTGNVISFGRLDGNYTKKE